LSIYALNIVYYDKNLFKVYPISSKLFTDEELISSKNQFTISHRVIFYFHHAIKRYGYLPRFSDKFTDQRWWNIIQIYCTFKCINNIKIFGC